MIRIELISENNFTKNSLDAYNRRQMVQKVYRKQDGKYVLVECPYIEDWDLEKKRKVASSISGEDCITYLAIEDDKIIGFICVLKEQKQGYMLLDVMQVSENYRRRGIGRKLFEKGLEEAKRCGSKGLYISACSSEETIAFYKAMGARIAEEPIAEIAESEPYDVQMECLI